MRNLVLIVGLLVIIGSCRTVPPEPERPDLEYYSQPLPPGKMALEKVDDPALFPDFRKGFHSRDRVLLAIERSISYFKKPSSKEHFPYLDISHSRALRSLEVFREVLLSARSAEELQIEILRRFDVYRSVGCDGRGTVLFTGYCEPIYDGSLVRTEVYRYPLYKQPPDLVKMRDGTPLGRRTESGEIVPYYTRREIEEGALLEGRGLELVYLRDKLEAYIVHVQGSARIRLPDGKEMEVGYAGKTDRPYTSIGELLIKDGKIKRAEMSLQKIKEYFREHPGELDHYLHQNECFVFFTETKGGPFGSIGVPVTPLASLATDKTVFPRGCLAFVETVIPVMRNGVVVSEPFFAFMLDQDTGGAIRSAGRGDIFIGSGPEAELLAGRTYHEGKLYYLFLKE